MDIGKLASNFMKGYILGYVGQKILIRLKEQIKSQETMRTVKEPERYVKCRVVNKNE